MPRLYAASDVVVLATWREGMPRVLMEGAAMGKTRDRRRGRIPGTFPSTDVSGE
jgi:hypothetical protein